MTDLCLFRPPPTTYLTPAATAAAAIEATRTQANPIAAQRRRAALADIGSEPSLSLVEVVRADAQGVRVRAAGGPELAWPVRHWNFDAPAAAEPIPPAHPEEPSS